MAIIWIAGYSVQCGVSAIDDIDALELFFCSINRPEHRLGIHAICRTGRLKTRNRRLMRRRQALKEMTVKLQRIGIAADHGGYELKGYLTAQLRAIGLEVLDFGDDHLKAGDDYPDFIVPLACAVADKIVDRGIGICGSGVGASVTANKVNGVRACIIHDNFVAHQSVEDDDLNLICFGGQVVGHAVAWELVQTFLAARFSNTERHVRCMAKVTELENKPTDITL